MFIFVCVCVFVCESSRCLLSKIEIQFRYTVGCFSFVCFTNFSCYMGFWICGRPLCSMRNIHICYCNGHSTAALSLIYLKICTIFIFSFFGGRSFSSFFYYFSYGLAIKPFRCIREIEARAEHTREEKKKRVSCKNLKITFCENSFQWQNKERKK